MILSVKVNNKRAGEQEKQIVHQPYGQASQLGLATVLTGADGTFSFATQPKILTTYYAPEDASP